MATKETKNDALTIGSVDAGLHAKTEVSVSVRAALCIVLAPAFLYCAVEVLRFMYGAPGG